MVRVRHLSPNSAFMTLLSNEQSDMGSGRPKRAKKLVTDPDEAEDVLAQWAGATRKR